MPETGEGQQAKGSIGAGDQHKNGRVINFVQDLQSGRFHDGRVVDAAGRKHGRETETEHQNREHPGSRASGNEKHSHFWSSFPMQAKSNHYIKGKNVSLHLIN